MLPTRKQLERIRFKETGMKPVKEKIDWKTFAIVILAIIVWYSTIAPVLNNWIEHSPLRWWYPFNQADDI